MSATHFTEIWKAVPEQPGYEVSSEGRVRSFWRRKGLAKDRNYFISNEPRMLKPWPDGRGYLRVDLTGGGLIKKRRAVAVMHLVLLAFVGPPLPGQLARHKENPDPRDARLCNLEWGTQRQNITVDVVRHYGKHPCSSLKPEDVRAIRERLQAGELHRLIAADYGVSRSTVSLIAQGKHHQYIE